MKAIIVLFSCLIVVACRHDGEPEPAAHDGVDLTLGCAGCHDGKAATGKTASHVPTSYDCISCHQSTQWLPLAALDHLAVYDTPCASCHDGQRARGKDDTHIASTSHCDACHSTEAWTPTENLDHDEIFGSCANSGCHTKPVVHISSTDLCEECHGPFTWLPVTEVDHTQVMGECAQCHFPPSIP